jgi:hypothetical protein
MARVKQFADDLGISKNQAQALINKGRSRKDGGSQILEKVMKKPIYAKKGKMYSNDAQSSNKNKNKKTSKQIIDDINEFELTKSDITASIDRDFSRKVAKQNEDAMKNVKKTNKKKDGGFPDLTGDGKVTKKDILKGRGVPGFSRGGGMAIQGLGFRGVK